MTPRTTIAGAATIVATRAAIGTVAATIRSAAARFSARTEIPELTSQFGVERVVEADSKRTIAGHCGLRRTCGGGAGARNGRS